MNQKRVLTIFFAVYALLTAQIASADYVSLQSSDCTFLTEFTGSGSWEFLKLINSSTHCSPYTLVGSTTPASIQVFSKCANGDILNPRFDVFTYDGTRGNEIGHSKLYQAGANFPIFNCDNLNRNVDGIIQMPLGSNLSFFVAASDASSSATVKNLFENGIGNFAHTLIHFDIGKGGAPQEPPKPDPVIIIPGILGSSDKNGVWVIDPIFHTYDDLIATLKANGYAEGKDLFTFPYDWRQSNVITAVQLRDKINEVQNICQCAKVDLVAHSMGGLVARQYIQSANYENDVDQLIFLGTPHLGAPFAYLTWEGGELSTKTGDLRARIKDAASKFVLSREARKAGFANLFDYVRNKPISSVQELLPIYNYLRDKDTGNLRIYPNNYPQNTFLWGLKIGVASLFDKVKITNIVGELDSGSTLNIIRVVSSPTTPLWEHGYPDGYDGSTADRGFEFGLGDATVPKNSSEFIVQDLNELSFGHNDLPTKAEGLVFKRLTNKTASILIDNGLSIIQKILIIKILSPIDVLVTAPDGKRIGKDFITNGEVNEIDGAFYSGFLTDDEYLTIPNPLDGEYKIETQGTGSGSYTVATGYISDNVSVDKDFTAQTQQGLMTELDLTVNNANPTALDIKPKDTTPPSINILSPASRDYLRSETLPINVNVSDAESGVFSQTIKFDDRIVNNGDNIDLFFEKLGAHQVSASTSDFIGNATASEVKFRIIATISSTISDIERAYSLDWISKKSVKNTLIKKLENIQNHNRAITQKNLKTFLAELERENPKNINVQAYNLLKEDINWLLNN